MRDCGLEFAVEPADVDEALDPGADPRAAAEELARRKAAAVGGRHAGEPVLVLGADTIVACPVAGTLAILGKPADADEARRSLRLLSGTRHQVVTGVAVWSGPEGRLRSAAERTLVSMRPIGEDEVEAYVASGEWRGKAGGYAIQETADAFVTGLEEGGFDNVVGLPVALARALLDEAGLSA